MAVLQNTITFVGPSIHLYKSRVIPQGKIMRAPLPTYSTYLVAMKYTYPLPLTFSLLILPLENQEEVETI